MSSTALYHCIAIYELTERLSLRTYRHLSTSHMRLVLPLPPDIQLSLLRQVEDNRWSVQRLDDEVSATVKAHRPDRRRGGRKRSSPLSKLVRALDRLVTKLSQTVSQDDPSANASPDSTRVAVETLQSVAIRCDNARAKLTTDSNLQESPPHCDSERNT
jgi:hypothetical protein